MRDIVSLALGVAVTGLWVAAAAVAIWGASTLTVWLLVRLGVGG